MKKTGSKLLVLFLALVMTLSVVIPALAADGDPIPYDGDGVNFVKEDGVTAFGMFAPQEGTTCVINGDDVVIHYVPKNTTTYNAIHWGPITDELTADVAFNENGTFDISIPKTNCGTLVAVAPMKPAGGTTSAQYYLAIPAESKLEDVTPLQPIPYDGDGVNFVKEDGVTGFGMFAPQEGTTCVINGDNVVIHYVPKNTTVYSAIHWGGITEELTADVAFNSDGTFDITLPKTNCGTGIPVAPMKPAGGTTSAQYYLGIPAESKLENVTPSAEPLDLTVTNSTGMFKAETARLETVDGQQYLVVALSGSGYHYMYKGTYAEAVANGDNRDSWIAGEQVDGKWTFRIPVSADDSYIPVVAISQSYLVKYENGQNPLERAFYPRQMELDRDAATLVTGDYDETATFTVSASGIQVAGTAQVRVVGDRTPTTTGSFQPS